MDLMQVDFYNNSEVPADPQCSNVLDAPHFVPPSS